MKLKDKDIRTALRNYLAQEFAYDSTTKVLEELGVSHWSGRIDMVAVNGCIHGYEIKSDADTLERLPNQVALFNKAFDSLSLVCTKKWIEEVVDLIPNWWGILLADYQENDVSFSWYRKPSHNPEMDIRSMVELLWRDEAIAVLERHGLSRGFRQKARWIMWDRLVENVVHFDLKESIREQLKVRDHYQGTFRKQLPCDDLL